MTMTTTMKHVKKKGEEKGETEEETKRSEPPANVLPPLPNEAKPYPSSLKIQQWQWSPADCRASEVAPSRLHLHLDCRRSACYQTSPGGA
jgi:hypothetical protein